MHTNKKQESSWFLTIVAFVMILFAVWYIISSVLGSSTLAKNTWNYEIQTEENSGSTNLQMEEDQEKIGNWIWESIALRVISWWNSIVENNDSTSSLALDISSKDLNNAEWENVASWYWDFSTTNKVGDNMQLTFANSYILPSMYQDISTSSYQEAITILYSHDIVKKSNLFYPHNFVRVSDFIRVVVDAYRVQLWYEQSSLEGLTNNFYITDPSFDDEVLRRVNTAYELWFLQSFALDKTELKLRLDTFITPQEAKDILSMIQNKKPSLIKNIPNISFQSKETLQKDEMAEIVVSAFWIKLNEWSLAVFSDISGSPYQDEIQLLSKLWIVWWIDGNFYPDAKIENKDFVIIIVRTLMRQSNSKPTIKNFYYLNNLLNDTSFNTWISTYAPYLEFCLESQVCNTLLTQQSQGVSFEPNKVLSQWDVTSLLANITQNKFIFTWDWSQQLTRWEVAKLIVDAFELNSQNSNSWTNTEWTLNLSWSIDWITSSDSDSGNVLLSFWTNFQDLMKIS